MIQLSAVSGQDFTLADAGKAVKFQAGVLTESTDPALLTTVGVLITPASTGSLAQYQKTGIARGIAGGALTHGDIVTVAANGRFVAATSGDAKIGQVTMRPERRAYPTLAAGDDVEVDLFSNKTELVP